MKESWQIINDYPTYQISNFGRVRRGNRLLKQNLNHYGYQSLTLSKLGVQRKCSIHRLVACAFIPNFSNKPCVNHKDGVKTNNHVSNLEWVTHGENLKHSYENNLRTRYKKLTPDIIKEIKSTVGQTKYLSIKFGVNKSTIKLARKY